MLIKGQDLTPEQKQQVFSAYVHRHYYPGPESEWLAAHAFHFIKSGKRLSAGHRYAVPAWMADHQEQA